MAQCHALHLQQLKLFVGENTCYRIELIKQLCTAVCCNSSSKETCIAHMKNSLEQRVMLLMQIVQVNEHYPLEEFWLHWGNTVTPTVSGITVLLCKVTHAEVQFCVSLSLQIRSHSPALRCCAVWKYSVSRMNLTNALSPQTITAQVVWHSSDMSTKPVYCLWSTVISDRLRSMWRSCGLTVQTILVIYSRDTERFK